MALRVEAGGDLGEQRVELLGLHGEHDVGGAVEGLAVVRRRREPLLRELRERGLVPAREDDAARLAAAGASPCASALPMLPAPRMAMSCMPRIVAKLRAIFRKVAADPPAPSFARGRTVQSKPLVREATEADIGAIRDAFVQVYGRDYPYQVFYEEAWLKRSIFNDDILTLVAEDPGTGRVAGTASVVFDVGAQSDLLSEFGRLVVHPDFRRRGIGNALMEGRIRAVENRVHVSVVENRCVHPYSQKVSDRYGFVPVGFLPLKHLFTERESFPFYVRHFGHALRLRANHPRIVPEAYPLAHRALKSCGLHCDAIVDGESAPYPYGDEFAVEDLTTEGLPSLIRIERGRVRNREIFGPMRLQYGFFQLSARRATYILARQQTSGDGPGPIAGAIGYIRDDMDRAVRVFELIARTDGVIRFLFTQLLERCDGDWDTAYVEMDVSAYAPRMQRTLLELGFLPVAYVPAMVFHDVERFDVVKVARLSVPIETEGIVLTEPARGVADLVVRQFERREVLPRIAEAVHETALFRGLNDEQVTRVAGACTLAEFGKGDELFRQGEAADRMFLLLNGRATVAVGSRRVGAVEAGESLGEVSLLTGETHSATARADEAVTAAALGSRSLHELTRLRPDIGVVLYRNLALGLGRKLQRMDSSIVSSD